MRTLCRSHVRSLCSSMAAHLLTLRLHRVRTQNFLNGPRGIIFYQGVSFCLKVLHEHEMSRVVRKQDYCLCENKDADQLRSNCEADQRLCFHYTERTISHLHKTEISSFLACFCDCTGWFVSDLVGNPEDRFSRVTAQIILTKSGIQMKSPTPSHSATAHCFKSTTLKTM